MAEPTYEELKARLSQLEKEVETKKRSGDLIFKVGEKGGVSVYGLGRFPGDALLRTVESAARRL